MKTIETISINAINDVAVDRRNYSREKRKDISISVKPYLFLKEPGSLFLLNISTHGAAICCRKSYSEKTKLFLNITFEENVNFSLKGEIRHLQEKEMVDATSRKKIHYYLYGIKFIDQPHEFIDYLVKSRFSRNFFRSFLQKGQ